MRVVKHRPFLVSFAVLSLTWQFALVAAEATENNRPNIIFILADDQGWNGTSVQMHPDLPNSKSDFYQTPHLEKLAKQGMVFSAAYSPGPMCSPTRASLQTGKSPAQLRMTNVGGRRRSGSSQKLIFPPHSSTLPTEETTIGEVLHDVGYATAWFGKWHLGGNGPEAHGYDESDGATGNQDGNSDDPENPKDIFGITERGIAFMEKNVEAGKPFYLQLWHYAVHGPIQSRPATKTKYDGQPSGKVHSSSVFAGMTENLDTGVGMILDKVDELGIAENTYVIYMSDHGAGGTSSNAPLNFGKGTLWEGGIRVPLIIRGPNVAANVYCQVPTAGWDMFPTFCDLAGLNDKLPDGIEGGTLKPLFKTGKGKVDRKYKGLAFHFPHYGQGRARTNSPHSTFAVDNFKLIKNYDAEELFLFDLANDIGESNNLANEMPSKVAAMHRQLNEYLKDVDAGFPELNPEFDPDAVAQSGQERGRQGRGRQRRSQLTSRVAQIEALKAALEKSDLKKLGDLVAEQKKAFESSPQRRGGPTGTNRDAGRREQRMKELETLSTAAKNGDKQKIEEILTAMQSRIQSLQSTSRNRRPGGPGNRQNSPDR